MLKTPLHAAHIALGAKMGEFSGYDMPLYYADGVLKEHEWTRTHAGLFDVSHMGQVIVEGPGTTGFLQKITPSTFESVREGVAKYTVLTNEAGGILDDLIITRIGVEKFFVVLNAGRKHQDIAWMQKNLLPSVRFDYSDEQALIALQGPESEKVLKEVFFFDAGPMNYMSAKHTQFHGIDVFVSRLGYTGEDGFEVSVPAAKVSEIWTALLKNPAVKPIGLAARDSLRLEMGYPLYGHDIDETTSPVEAGIAWVIAKDRADYIGASVIQDHLKNRTQRKRIGIRLLDKGIAREHSDLYTEAGEKIGMMTSGGFSPTLKQSIGQGYVQNQYAGMGQKIFVDVRGRKIAAEVAGLSFVPARTKSVKKSKGT